MPATSGTTLPPQSSIWYVMPAAAAAAATSSTITMATTRPRPCFFSRGSGARNSFCFGAALPSTRGISMVSPERHAAAGGV